MTIDIRQVFSEKELETVFRLRCRAFGKRTGYFPDALDNTKEPQQFAAFVGEAIVGAIRLTNNPINQFPGGDVYRW